VGGIAVVFAPQVTIVDTISGVATAIMLTVTVLVTLAVLTFKRLPRVVGFVLIGGYVASIPLLF
jgi:hypothetical protein